MEGQTMRTGTRAAVLIVTACVVLWPAAGYTQEFPDLRKQLEAGKSQEVADAIAGKGDASEPMIYLAGQAYQKAGQADPARGMYSRLAGGPEDRAWTFVGRSAIAAMDGNYDEAVNAARKATELDGNLAEAHYQLGLAEAYKQNFAGAAAALTKASELDPQSAYAHYQAGLAHYKNQRPDLMATHFEMFLKLAPEAPERPEVESIMRTLRGR
jgi:tetratricopeptide (TPR) repeat protein